MASGANAGTSAIVAEDARAGKPKAKAGKRKRGGAAAAAAEGTAVGDRLAAAGLAAQSWWLEAVDVLVVHSGDGGAAAAQHIKAQLGDLDSCASTSFAFIEHVIYGSESARNLMANGACDHPFAETLAAVQTCSCSAPAALQNSLHLNTSEKQPHLLKSRKCLKLPCISQVQPLEQPERGVAGAAVSDGLAGLEAAAGRRLGRHVGDGGRIADAAARPAAGLRAPVAGADRAGSPLRKVLHRGTMSTIQADEHCSGLLGCRPGSLSLITDPRIESTKSTWCCGVEVSGGRPERLRTQLSALRP